MSMWRTHDTVVDEQGIEITVDTHSGTLEHLRLCLLDHDRGDPYVVLTEDGAEDLVSKLNAACAELQRHRARHQGGS